MKMAFVDGWRPRGRNRDLLDTLLEIVDEYQRQRLKLTVRQLHYQLVSRGAIVNTAKQYSGLVDLVKNARMAGLLDWDAIEDRGRAIRSPFFHASPAEAIKTAALIYKRDRLEGQDRIIEVWVEKAALSGVLLDVCYEYGAGLFAARGYSSATSFWDFRNRMLEDDREPVILYLGDLDPSGEQMTEDVENRASLLYGDDVEVERLALNPDQVQAYDLIPQPAKTSDSRARAFIERNGTECYELDALPPRALIQIVRDGIESYLDMPGYESALAREEADREVMQGISGGLNATT